MSTLLNQKARAPSPLGEEDPFRIGWRDRIRTLPDGTTRTERIPLTLQDALHPQFGDVLVESSLHDLIRRYLADVFTARTAGDPTALVLSDVGIYWDDPELDHHSPDVTLIFGIKRRKANWSSFNVAEEGVRPRTLLEVVSPNTRVNDVQTKVDHYHRLQIPYYIIVDREKEDSPWNLIGYQYTPLKYLPMSKDERGRLWLEPLGIWIGIKEDRVVCYDGQTDEEIGDYTEISRRLGEEKARAEAEKARAEAEKTRAEAEKTRAENAEARLREFEVELERLRGQSPPP